MSASPALSSVRPEVERAVDLLRSYLDEVGFVRLHKYLTGASLYYVNPHVVRQQHTEVIGAISNYATGPCADLPIALCLLADVPFRREDILPHHAELADSLVGAGLLSHRGEHFRMGGLQLISAQGMPLFIDHRQNFSRRLHDVYIGPDSLLLTHYVDHEALAPDACGLDLGTGTGYLALYLARYCERVTATDIMPAPLWLAGINVRLNGAAGKVELRRESYVESVAQGQRYQVVSFNPPFIALPDEMNAPPYAKGIGDDGLDYCRMLIELFDEVVAPGGVAYIVADLLGDDEWPYFVADLEGYARSLDLAIELYVDSRLSLNEGAQHEALAAALRLDNPGLDFGHIQERIRHLQVDVLRAECVFLSVMVIRRAGAEGHCLRLLNRYAKAPPRPRG